MAQPFKIAEYEILYGEGISRTGELIDLGVEHDLVKKAGSWYSYGDDRIGQGKENAKAYLSENPEIIEELDGLLRAKLLPDLSDYNAEGSGEEAETAEEA